MRIKDEDLQLMAIRFRELTLGKYELAVVETDKNPKHLYNPAKKPRDGMDELIQKSLLACMNDVLLNKEKLPVLRYRPPQEEKDAEVGFPQTPYYNTYLWEEFAKKKQQ